MKGPAADEGLRAVVLLSGGLDSYTAAAVARNDGYSLYALTISYGQRHRQEIESARRVASALDVARHIEIDLALSQFGGSALTGAMDVPKDRDLETADIPVTYVPARNTIFLSLALAWAEVLSTSTLVMGVNAIDYSGYPDCRPEFVDAFARLANLATRAGVAPADDEGPIVVHTPLIELTKGEIIRRGIELGVDHRLTTSCYDPLVVDGQPVACGRCDSCLLRRKGFAEVGRTDPIRYVDEQGVTP
jgi:7-cyano-7-deazaguanine synthase